MRKVYEAYKDLASIPEELEIISWSQNCILVDKIEDIDKRVWHAKQIIENGWSKTVLSHQIDLKLYERQALPEKMTNSNDKLPIAQSEFARDMIKDPYIFELANIGKRAKERDIENAMLERIKNVLLELGKGFSFVGNQYIISTNDNDYYIDLLFYHLDLRCFVVVELKNTEFRPEYVGQLGFYVTAVDETLKKETDNETIGLLLCEDKLTVEWSLKSVNAPIGVASYKVKNVIPKEIMEKLPTEEELNLYIKKLPNEENEEENDFKESKSITILREIVEKNNRIKVKATEADKIANLDGKVVIIDKNGFGRIYIEIQAKTLPEKYNLKKQYSYSCDTKAFNVVLEHITFNPVVLFLVDEQRKRVFWKLISNEYVKSLNIGNQEKKTIYFNDQDLFCESNFIEKISNYCDSLCEIIDKKDADKSLISSNIDAYSTEYIEI